MRVLTAGILVGLATDTVLGQETPPTVLGYVLSVRGEWFVGSGQQATHSGRALQKGDTIRAGRKPWRGNEIVIVLRDGAAVRYSCADAPPTQPRPEAWDCARPVALSAARSTPLASRMLDAVMHHFGEHPSRPASLVSRSILDPDLRESVALLQNGTLDLRDALSALPADDYGFRLTAIQVDRGVVTQTGEPTVARLSWDPRAPRPLNTPGLQPGLYELGIVGASDVAWILVCAGNDCDAMRTQFHEVSQMATRWAGQVSAPDARAFVRSALDFLQRQRTVP
jgi:hypothetical protein